MNIFRLIKGTGVGAFFVAIYEKSVTIASLHGGVLTIPITNIVLFQRMLCAVLFQNKFDRLCHWGPYTYMGFLAIFGKIYANFALPRIYFLHHLPQRLDSSIRQPTGR